MKKIPRFLTGFMIGILVEYLARVDYTNLFAWFALAVYIYLAIIQFSEK